MNIFSRGRVSLPNPFGAAIRWILSPGTIRVCITAGVLLFVFLRSSGSPTMDRRKLSVDVALGYSGVHRVLERVSGDVDVTPPDIREYYRHSSVLADGHAEFRGEQSMLLTISPSTLRHSSLSSR